MRYDTPSPFVFVLRPVPFVLPCYGRFRLWWMLPPCVATEVSVVSRKFKKKCWHKQTCFKLKSKQTKHRWLVKGCIVYAKRYPSGKDLKVYWYCWVFGLFVRLCHVVRMCIVVVLFVHMMFLSPAVSIVHRVGFSLPPSLFPAPILLCFFLTLFRWTGGDR